MNKLRINYKYNMKKNCLNICLLALLALGGCQSERTEFPSQGEYGYLALDCQTSAEVETRAAAAVTAPAVGDLTMTIQGKGDQADYTWTGKVSAFDTNENPLQKGDYTVTATWGDMTQEGPALPCFEGSKDFTILPQKVSEVALTVQICNSMVQVACTEAFKSYFHDARFTLTTAAGNSFEMTPEETALEANQVSEHAVFVAPGTFTLKGTALKQTDKEITFAKELTAAARTCHTVKFDVNAGTATVTITFDDTVIAEEPIDVELNPEA